MKILLINPPNIPFSEPELLIEPIDILGIGTYLQEQKHNVNFLDMDCRKLNCEDLTKYIKDMFMADVAVISYDYHIPLHTDRALKNISKICSLLKEKNIKIIMIGKTVSYNPNIIKEINFDIGIIGEVENTITQVLEKSSKLENIKGIVFQRDNEIIINSSSKEKYNLEK